MASTSGYLNTTSYEGRYYQFYWTATQSAANNRSTISWTLSALGGTATWYAERTLILTAVGSTLYSKTARVERYTGQITSGTFHVDHDDNGDAYFAVNIQAAVYVSSVNCTGSTSFQLTRISRASSLTASNGTLNTAQTLTITRQDSTFQHKITYTCGDTSGYAAGSSSTFTTATSISWTPPLSLASQNTTGTSLSATLYLKTYTSDGTQIGTVTKSITLTIPSASVKPTVSIAVSDPTGYLSTYGGYVQGKSQFKVVVTASGKYSATIKSYKTVANGSTYTTATSTTGVVTTTGTNTITTTVTDSRKITNTASATATVLAYSNPKITKVTVNRCDSDGTLNTTGSYLKVVFSSSVTSLSSKNTATYTLKYKKTTASAYTTVTLSDYANNYAVSSGSYIFAADTGSSYNVSLTVADAFTDMTLTGRGASVFKLWSLLYGGVGIAFGKIAEIKNAFECALNAYFTGNVYGNVYGLAAGESVPSSANLNDYTAFGNYAVRQNSVAATLTNAPTTVAGRLLVSNALGQDSTVVGTTGWIYVRQEYIPYDPSVGRFERLMYRNASNTWTYGAWTQSSLAKISTYINSVLGDRSQKTLWTGGHFMAASQTATLSEAISDQPNGIVLMWSYYNGSASEDTHFNFTFIPKHYIAELAGHGMVCKLSNYDMGLMGSKYLYVNDTTITGHAINESTGTSYADVIYTNNKFVLRRVYGV